MPSRLPVIRNADYPPHLSNPFPVLGGATAITLAVSLLLFWAFERPVRHNSMDLASSLDVLLGMQSLLIGLGLIMLVRTDMRIVVNTLAGIAVFLGIMEVAEVLRTVEVSALPILAMLGNIATIAALLLIANSLAERNAPFLMALGTTSLLLAISQMVGAQLETQVAELSTAPFIWFAQIALSLSFLTIAVLWNLDLDDQPRPWIPAAFGFVLLSGTFLFWSMLTWERFQQNQETVKLGSRAYSSEFLSRVETLNRPLFELAEMWKVSGLVNLQEWNRIALRKVEENQALEALLWIDPGYRVRLVSSLSAHQEKLGLDLSTSSAVTDLLVRAEVTRSVLLTASAPTVHGEGGFLTVLPIQTHQSFSGYVAGVVSLDKLVAAIREREIWNGYGLQLLAEKKPIFTAAADQTYRRQWAQVIPVEQFGEQWELHIWPEEAKIEALYSPLPEGVLIAGILIALLATGLMSLYQVNRRRSIRVRRTNQRLAEHVRSVESLQKDLLQTNAKLNTQYDRLQSVMDHATDAILTVNEDGYFEGVNRAAEQHFGYSAREFIGRHAEILLPKKHRKTLHQALQTLRESGMVPPSLIERDARLQRADGTLFFSKFTVSRVEDGDKIFYIVFISDVTKQRETEAALTRARRAAEMANEQKSSFLANMSHEIRTPMNGVIGMSALLQDTPLSTLQKDYLRTIQNSAESLLGIINDILDFSKVEAGKLTLEHVEFNLRSDLEDLIDLLGLLAREKGLILQLRYRPGTPLFFRGDPVRIRQIITNFVNNALKFTHEGHVLIEVSAVIDKASQADVHFRIEDTGIGIPPEKFADIFRDFTQADTSTTRKYGGTGLGLTIAKRLTEMMNGRISVDSTPGVGTSFDIALQLEVVEKESYRSAHGEFRGRRALVLDPAEMTRTIACEQLTSWGLEVDEFQHPQRALGTLDRALQDGAPYHILLFDKRFPEGSGIEFARTVRANPAYAALRMIMLTSQPEVGDGQRARDSGIDGYLPRPCHEDDLHGVVRKLLTRETVDAAELVTRLSVAEESGSAQSSSPQVALSATVLLVEDNLVNQKVAKKMLEKLGCTVDIANDGNDALVQWRSKRYDAILMDCQMPGMDGYEATRIIRSEEGSEHGHIPILALTANAMSKDRDLCLQAGMDDHISKPVKISTLAEALGKHLTVH